MAEKLRVQERGQVLEFTVADLLRYAGPYSPAGVAIAFQVMQCAFELLSPTEPPPRRCVVVRTAFQGPGARDGFEMVTRAVTDGRYTVELGLTRPERGRLLQSFVFEVHLGNRSATLLLRDGFVTEEFIDLAGKPDRDGAEETRLNELKANLAGRLLAAPAGDVYEVVA
ncbi:hypothetical protein BMW24_018015 [Mycobacterium heckeshornense]|uniref:Uncharacterized protein n=1 Tax=Mycobacterium heckeshornense TaxID=110505 RepID=A0A2G8B4J9_9MYCO|nr:hypothetical protein [Mycobacterium heckeshornense]KMV22432.1 hypothetical protein ACT16_11395 [Mycobacterium heckeshornense]MCV7034745.1 hypothetical protein [Mycobacterium heckeshornense]PIJ32556.1 hypothetical protein BMW24_018015 [Mycobacterium heckeshornense]BCO36795.1 hypothetical protein MHEC_32280 [Mycobacterium heckeshornense]